MDKGTPASGKRTIEDQEVGADVVLMDRKEYPGQTQMVLVLQKSPMLILGATYGKRRGWG